MKTRSLRFRMMMLFCLVVGVLLLGTCAITYSIFARELRFQLDRRLNEAGVPMVEDLAANPPDEDVFRLDLPDEYLELLDASGQPLNMSRNWREHPIDVGSLNFLDGKPIFRTVQVATGPLRVELIPFVLSRHPVVLAIAGPTRDVDIVLGNFRKVLIVLIPLGLVLMGAISAWYVGRSLSPITELTNHAARVAQSIAEPHHTDMRPPRLAATSKDELGLLATTFNDLVARVVGVLHQLRQFVSNASHELRTPLAVLQGETELLLSERRAPEEYHNALAVIQGELRHLSRIVEALFTLSMADVGQLKVSADPVYINEIVEEACEMAVPLSRTKNIRIEQVIEPDVISSGDESLLRDLFLAILENAVKYSPRSTRIRVSLVRVDGKVVARFEDQGVGIAPEHLPHIFERFYRGAGQDGGEARSGGLGLAIAEAIAKAHNGRIEVQTELGRGSVFTVILPLTSANVGVAAADPARAPAL
jgi:signal transduction histidine kinase